MDDTSRVTRLEVCDEPTGDLIASMDREHHGQNPWVLTVDAGVSAAGGRYATTVQTVEQADRLLQAAVALVTRYVEQRAALDLAVRQQVRAIVDAAGQCQDALPGVEG